MATRAIKKNNPTQPEIPTPTGEPEIVFEPAALLVEDVAEPVQGETPLEIVFEPAALLVEETTPPVATEAEPEVVFEPAALLVEETTKPAKVAQPRRTKAAIKSVGEAIISPAQPSPANEIPAAEPAVNEVPAAEPTVNEVPAAEPGLNNRNFLVPYILLMLRDTVMHGYAIWEQLTLMGIPGLSENDRVNIYRTLRQLEREGKISSQWETGQSGPAKRVYSLTSGGENFLRLGALGLRQYRQSLDFFFKLYTGGRLPSPFETSLPPVVSGTDK